MSSVFKSVNKWTDVKYNLVNVLFNQNLVLSVFN